MHLTSYFTNNIMGEINWVAVTGWLIGGVAAVWGLVQWLLKYAVPKVLDSQIRIREMQIASDLGQAVVAQQVGNEATIHAIAEATDANEFIRQNHSKLSNGITAKIEKILDEQDKIDRKIEQIKTSLSGLLNEMAKIKLIINGEVTHKRTMADILADMENRLKAIEGCIHHDDN